MATKMFYVTRDMKHPLYRGRMLKAGEPLELDGPTGRLYQRLNAVSDQKPSRTAAKAAAPKPDLSSKTKAELAKQAGLSAAEAKKLSKVQIIAKIEG
jgi:hypothetical protein